MPADRQNSPINMEANKENKIADTLVSEVVEQAASNVNNLMHLIDPWDTEEDVSLTEQKAEKDFALPQMSAEHPWDRDNEDIHCCPSPAVTEVSIITYSSWVSNPDSDVTDVFTPDIEDVDQEAAEHLWDTENKGVSYCPSPAVSEVSITTYSSWESNSDSDVTDGITPDIQDVNEEIRKVCRYYVYGENLDHKDQNEASPEHQILLEVRPTEDGEEPSTEIHVSSGPPQVEEQIVSFNKEDETSSGDQLVVKSSEEQWMKANEDHRHHSHEETPATVQKSQRNQSLWSRCFSGRQRNKIRPYPLDDSRGYMKPHSIICDQQDHQTETSASSSSQPQNCGDKKTFEATKDKQRSGFRRFFCYIFSKKDEKQKTEQEKRNTLIKKLHLWKHLSFCSSST